MTRQASPKAQARAEAQRERILEAAQSCFAGHGFHAANMAGIAEAAGVSAGLIYRYFECKSDIVLAIIERQLELTRSKFADLHHSTDLSLDIWQSIIAAGAQEDLTKPPALYAEMSAEASRDPRIAAAVAASDRMLREEFIGWLMRRPDEDGLGLPAAHARSVGLLLQCLVDGLRLRRLREPDVDRDALRRALQDYLPLWLDREAA